MPPGMKQALAPLWTMDTTTSVILSSNKIQNENILVPANPGPPGKMVVKLEIHIPLCPENNEPPKHFVL